MKIRNGFVSNSSTSSFCIYGIFEDDSFFSEKLIEKGLLTEDDDGEALLEAMEKIANDNSLTLETIGDSSMTALGGDLSSIPDNVVVGEWKKEIANKIKELFGDKVSCEVYLEAWYN